MITDVVIINDKNEILDHYLSLDVEDRQQRFNVYANDEYIMNYINWINMDVNKFWGVKVQNKVVALLQAIDIGLDQSNKKLYEVALSVNNEYKKLGYATALLNAAKYELNDCVVQIIFSASNYAILQFARKNKFDVKKGEYNEYVGIFVNAKPESCIL